MSGTAAALGGIRVLDISTGVAGQYCGELLPGYGADCVLAVPPEGSPTRRMGPYLTSARSSTRSAMFLHLNQGKSSLVHQAGNGRIQAMTALADVRELPASAVIPLDQDAAPGRRIVGPGPRQVPTVLGATRLSFTAS